MIIDMICNGIITTLYTAIRFEFIVVLIGLINGVQYGTIRAAISVETIVNMIFLGAVYNRIIVVLSILIGMAIVAAIGSLIVVLIGVMYCLEINIIVLPLCDIITAKIGFISVIFDIIRNDILCNRYI